VNPGSRLFDPDDLVPSTPLISWIEVQPRWRPSWLFLTGIGALFVLFLILNGESPSHIDRLFTSISAGLLGGLFAKRLQGPYFRYEPRLRLIEARGSWGGRRLVYPRPGFVRIEYSAATTEVNQVRADGSRKRIWVTLEGSRRDQWD
jgi:hypothetical protein